jgi:putative ABC transport system permease protein
VRVLSSGLLAFRAIVQNPLRAGLTVLGILIAVAAVVTVDALGAGGREHVSRQIDGLGSNFILVFPQPSQASGAHGAQGSGMRLTEDDGRAILRESTSVLAVAPALRASVQVVYGDQNWLTQAFGTRLSYLTVRNWAVETGLPWDAHDEATKAKVLLLGKTVAQNLFGGEDPVGRTVRIGRYPYRVTGVLSSKGETPFGADQDDVVLMPSTSFRSRVTRTPPNFAGAIMASATSSTTTDRAVEQIDAILRQRHRIEGDREPDFTIRTQKEFAAMKDRISAALSVLLVFVAAVSLLVGGIGIMNIMLVSVTERTREIGIRIAVGGQPRDIMLQFLIEAITLSLLGGLIGILVGVGASQLVAVVADFSAIISCGSVILAFCVSFVIGVFFGFYPARRAAALDPIDALHYE